MSTSALAAVVTKLTGLGIAGKAVVGVAVTTVALGTVGVAHADSSAPQDPITVPTASASASATAGATTEPTEKAKDGATDEATEHATAEPTVKTTDKDADEATEHATRPTDLPPQAAFGQSVAAAARDGGVDGRQISTDAKARAELRQPEVKTAAAPVVAPTSSATADASMAAHVPGDRPTARH
jgi:hypothetical protein